MSGRSDDAKDVAAGKQRFSIEFGGRGTFAICVHARQCTYGKFSILSSTRQIEVLGSLQTAQIAIKRAVCQCCKLVTASTPKIITSHQAGDQEHRRVKYMHISGYAVLHKSGLKSVKLYIFPNWRWRHAIFSKSSTSAGLRAAPPEDNAAVSASVKAFDVDVMGTAFKPSQCQRRNIRYTSSPGTYAGGKQMSGQCIDCGSPVPCQHGQSYRPHLQMVRFSIRVCRLEYPTIILLCEAKPQAAFVDCRPGKPKITVFINIASYKSIFRGKYSLSLREC